MGRGRNLPFYPESVRFTGIDFSPGMLAHHPGQLGLDRLRHQALRAVILPACSANQPSTFSWDRPRSSSDQTMNAGEPDTTALQGS